MASTVSIPYRAYPVSYHPDPWMDPWVVEIKPMRKTRPSCAKFIERQVIQAWKRVTGATRKPQRASFLPKDFVIVNARRRSVMFR